MNSTHLSRPFKFLLARLLLSLSNEAFSEANHRKVNELALSRKYCLRCTYLIIHRADPRFPLQLTPQSPALLHLAR